MNNDICYSVLASYILIPSRAQYKMGQKALERAKSTGSKYLIEPSSIKYKSKYGIAPSSIIAVLFKMKIKLY
mgnify:CR=1 FL=1